ncbi:RNA methyltransferase [Caldovatus sediminis]|uniref:RNA methyltransferase n=1 Tax=Caldovatus sediminis TaxID=2041189 RepID=A0A8J2ZEV4_9PROT|nr:class I SAM-dependent RNA methyltransferase [Caldovatus sediminis]GGG49465.1 RNA methyltransferase [Caldovatus sediminis]
MSGGTADLLIERIGAAGDGVAALADGTPAFIPHTLPGERVRARLLGRRGEGHAALAEAILAPSPDRVAPPCPHFLAGCGGCALQHWADAPYAAWKRARVAEALERAGFADPAVAEPARTPPWARRRADLALRRAPDGSVAIGFHLRGSAAVLDLATCHILDPRLFALLDPLRAALRHLNALRREGSAILNLLDTGPDLLLRTDGPLNAPDRAALAALARAQAIPRIAHARGEAPPETAAQLGPAAIRFAGVAVAPPPGAFLQASPQGEAAIVAAVLAGLPERLPARARIADLYAGVGTLSFPLAARARTLAFEGAAEAQAALDAAARRAGARVEAHRRDLARQPLLPVELGQFAALVLDPPYAGAAAQMAQIARAGRDAAPPRVIYVSCNPAALARDAAVLRRAGYALHAATPVDQFLWSAQIEAVAVFARGGRA